jgi:hypothetical protein
VQLSIPNFAHVSDLSYFVTLFSALPTALFPRFATAQGVIVSRIVETCLEHLKSLKISTNIEPNQTVSWPFSRYLFHFFADTFFFRCNKQLISSLCILHKDISSANFSQFINFVTLPPYPHLHLLSPLAQEFWLIREVAPTIIAAFQILDKSDTSLDELVDGLLTAQLAGQGKKKVLTLLFALESIVQNLNANSKYQKLVLSLLK